MPFMGYGPGCRDMVEFGEAEDLALPDGKNHGGSDRTILPKAFAENRTDKHRPGPALRVGLNVCLTNGDACAGQPEQQNANAFFNIDRL